MAINKHQMAMRRRECIVLNMKFFATSNAVIFVQINSHINIYSISNKKI